MQDDRTDATPTEEQIIKALYEDASPIGLYIKGREHVYYPEGCPQGARMKVNIAGEKPFYMDSEIYDTNHNAKNPDRKLIGAITRHINAARKGEMPPPGAVTLTTAKPMVRAASPADRVAAAAHQAQAAPPPPLPSPLLGARALCWVPKLRDFRPATIVELNPDGTVRLRLILRDNDPKVKLSNFSDVRLFDRNDPSERAGRWAVLAEDGGQGVDNATRSLLSDTREGLAIAESKIADLQNRLGKVIDIVEIQSNELQVAKAQIKKLESNLDDTRKADPAKDKATKTKG